MRDLGESVRNRLRHLARQSGLKAELMLSRFVMERFIARLSASCGRSACALKGGLLNHVWYGDLVRATTDMDVHWLDETMSGKAGDMVAEVCGSASPAEEDGIVFKVARTSHRLLSGKPIRGERVIVPALIGTSETTLRVDVSYGHAITPGLETLWYPTLLAEFDPIGVQCYPKETVVAEKLAACVEFGAENSRFKDFFDLANLASRQTFSGKVLETAMRATFARRAAGACLLRDDDCWRGCLKPEFASRVNSKSWDSWLRGRCPGTSMSFDEALRITIAFGLPLLQALRLAINAPRAWHPATGWSSMRSPDEPDRQMVLGLNGGPRALRSRPTSTAINAS